MVANHYDQLLVVRTDLIIVADIEDQGVEDDLDHGLGLFVTRGLTDQRDIVVCGQDDLLTVVCQRLGDRAGALHIVLDQRDADELRVVGRNGVVVFFLRGVQLRIGENAEVALHFAEGRHIAEQRGPKERLVVLPHGRAGLDVFLIGEGILRIICNVEVLLEGCDRGLVVQRQLNLTICIDGAAALTGGIDDADDRVVPDEQTEAVVLVHLTVLVEVFGDRLAERAEGVQRPVAVFHQLIGVFEVVVLDQLLVEHQAEGCIVVRAGDVTRGEEHNIADREALVGLLIPPGLREVNAGHRIQVVQKPAVCQHRDIVARNQSKVIAAVARADIRADLHKAGAAARGIRLFDILVNLDLVVLLHQATALVLRIVERQRRLFVKVKVVVGNAARRKNVERRAAVVCRLGHAERLAGLHRRLLCIVRRCRGGCRCLIAAACKGSQQKQRAKNHAESFHAFPPKL